MPKTDFKELFGLDENVSGAQHFTELDFDISAIPGQLEEIERLIEKKGKDIQAIINKDWKIKDVLEVADGGTGVMGKELNTAISQLEQVKTIKAGVVEALSSMGQSARQAGGDLKKALNEALDMEGLKLPTDMKKKLLTAFSADNVSQSDVEGLFTDFYDSMQKTMSRRSAKLELLKNNNWEAEIANSLQEMGKTIAISMPYGMDNIDNQVVNKLAGYISITKKPANSNTKRGLEAVDVGDVYEALDTSFGLGGNSNDKDLYDEEKLLKIIGIVEQYKKTIAEVQSSGGLLGGEEVGRVEAFAEKYKSVVNYMAQAKNIDAELETRDKATIFDGTFGGKGADALNAYVAKIREVATLEESIRITTDKQGDLKKAVIQYTDQNNRSIRETLTFAQQLDAQTGEISVTLKNTTMEQIDAPLKRANEEISRLSAAFKGYSAAQLALSNKDIGSGERVEQERRLALYSKEYSAEWAKVAKSAGDGYISMEKYMQLSQRDVTLQGDILIKKEKQSIADVKRGKILDENYRKELKSLGKSLPKAAADIKVSGVGEEQLPIIEKLRAGVEGLAKTSSAVTAEDVLQLQHIRKQVEEVNSVIDAERNSAAVKKAQKGYAEDVYKANEKALSLSKQISSRNSSATADERQKMAVIKDQTDEMVRQLQTKKQFTAADLEQLSGLKEQLRVMENQAKTSQSNTVQAVKDGQSYLEKAKNFFSYRSFGYMEQAAKSGVQAIRDVETQMSEINRVMSLGEDGVNSLKASLFGLGKDYGREFESVADISLRYAQAGYNVADTLEMTKVSLLAVNTAELDIENSTNSMIGILQQWGMEAKDLSGVMDVLNYTADNNAITTQDLVDALLNASSVAKVANMNFRDTVGVLTAMKEASGRSGKEVGNAFKSILSYIQRASSLKAFDAMGIEVYANKATGALLPMMDILSNMTGKWNTMGKATQDAFISDNAELMSEELAIATGTTEEFAKAQDALSASTDAANTAEVRNQAAQSAGIYRRNYYIALMENFGKALEVSKESLDAEGYSAKENGVYMETLDAKLKTLVTALKELAVQAADAGLMDLAKGAVEAASAVTGVIKNTGGLTNAMLALAGVMAIIKAKQIAGIFTELKVTLATATNGIKNVVIGLANMKGATTTTAIGVEALGKSTAVAGLTMQSFLGIIGLVTIGVSLIVGAVMKHNAAMEESRIKNIENAKATKETAEGVSSLVDEYKALSSQTNLTDEAKTRLKSIQDELIGTYGLEKEGIDLVNGSYDEQLEKLDALSDKKLEAAKIAAQLALNDANKKAKVRSKNIYAQGSYDTEEYGKFINENLGGLPGGIGRYGNTLNFVNGTIGVKGGSQAKDVVDDLGKALKWLSNNGYETSRMYEELGANLTKYTTIADEQATAQENTNKINDIYAQKLGFIDAAEQARVGTLSGFEKSNYYLSKSVGAVEESANGAAAAVSDYDKAVESTSSSVDEMISQLNDVNINETKRAEIMKKLAAEAKNYQASISSLTGYIDTLNSGGKLTAEQMLSLIETHAELASQVIVTSDGFSIEVSALEALKGAQVDSALSIAFAQSGLTTAVLTEVASRAIAYSDEILAIKSLADAQDVLAKAKKTKAAEYDWSEGKGYTGFMQWEEAQRQASTVIDTLSAGVEVGEIYKKLLNNLGKSSADSGKKLGDSMGYAGDKAEETKQSLSDLTSEFDSMVDMGLLSTKEQIKYFEQLQKTTKLTAENTKSVQSKLHSLYMAQIKDEMALSKKASDDKISAIEAEYDAKLAALDGEEGVLNSTRETSLYDSKVAAYEKIMADMEFSENDRSKAAADLVVLQFERNQRIEDLTLAGKKTQLESEKQAAIKKENEKQSQIEKIFTDANLDMIAAAGNFVPELYNKFLDFFTNPLKDDLDGLVSLMEELAGKSEQIKLSAGRGEIVGGEAGKPAANATTGAGGLEVGSKVRVNGSVYGNSQGQAQGTSLSDYVGKITSIAQGAPMPYHIDGKGWVSPSEVVKARTGGETLADGLAYLHKNEFVANSEITAGMKMIIDPKITDGLRKMAEVSKNIYNNVNNSDNRNESKSVSVVVNENVTYPMAPSESTKYRDRKRLTQAIAREVR